MKANWVRRTVSLRAKAAAHTACGHGINRGPLTTGRQGALELGIGQGFKQGGG